MPAIAVPPVVVMLAFLVPAGIPGGVRIAAIRGVPGDVRRRGLSGSP